MTNKKALTTVFVLLLMQQSSTYAHDYNEEQNGFYLGGSHSSQFFSNIGTLGVIGYNTKVYDVSARGTKEQSTDNYKQVGNLPFTGSLVYGYTGNFNDHSYMVELEGMYSYINTKSHGLTNSPAILQLRQNDSNKFIALKDNSIKNKSLMANAYYNVKNDRFSFTPYIGGGLGITQTNQFGVGSSIKPAYQLKAGVTYQVASNTSVNVGYKHFGIIDNGFNVKGKEGIFDDQGGKKLTGFRDTNDDITIKNSFGTHGLEVGMTVRFTTQSY